jgi:ATP-dependent Lon protease
VLQLLKLPDGTVKVLVEGAQRAKVVKYTDCSEYYEAEAVALGDTMGERVEAEALARTATTEFESYVKLNKKVLCRSSTILSMPFRSRMWDSSNPAGPPPMIATWVRIAISAVV